MRDLTNGKESRLIFRFALPMLIGNVLQQLYNTVDGIIVGRFIGKQALAAVGISFPVLFLLISLVMGLSMGATILLSQFYGAKKYDEVVRTVDTLLLTNYVVAIFISILGVFIAKPLLIALNTPIEIIPQALTYLKIIFIGMIGLVGYNLISAILRGLGDSKTPLLFLAIATVLNIVLDVVFVVWFDMGVGGAAWATVIAQTASFVFGIYHLNKKDNLVKIKYKNFQFDFKLFKESIRIGLPSGIQQMLVSVSFIVFQAMVNPFGTVVIAAYTASSRLQAFAVMPAMNMSMAISAFTGQNIGAQKYDRVKRGFWAGQIMSGAIIAFVTLIFIIFGKQLLILFNEEQDVVRIGYEYLKIVTPFLIASSIMFITFGVLRGAGDTKASMVISIFILWGVRLPVAKVLIHYLGYKGLFWGIVADFMAGAIITVIYYKTNKWKNKINVSELAIEKEDEKYE